MRATAIGDEDIVVDVIDYGIPTRSRPSLRKVEHAELRSGVVDLNGEEVRTSSLSSFRKAREIAGIVKSWVEQGILIPVLACTPDRSAEECTAASRDHAGTKGSRYYGPKGDRDPRGQRSEQPRREKFLKGRRTIFLSSMLQESW